MRTIVWYRGNDLRLADHEPLRAALEGQEVIPLFVLDPHFFTPARARQLPHRMQFLLESLTALAQGIAARGSELVVVRGKSVEVVPELARAFKADRVVTQRWMQPFARERDRRVRNALGARFELCEGQTLLPPGFLRTGSGRPYAVFTQFRRSFFDAATIAPALPTPRSLPPLPRDLRFDPAPIPTLAALGLTRNPALLPGGETAARRRLRQFLRGPAADYAQNRNRLDLDGTSHLSADLKFGTLSVREVWHAVQDALGSGDSTRAFLNELVWREFSHSTLWDRPALLHEPFRPDFAGFPWIWSPAHWDAWTKGQTGYPIVDAACRQLLIEGFVPNRARMIAASFLTKHLLIDYRHGEAHYMRYLTDGDPAQNNAGWQWSAGCGCDAQPYFRVFNPMTQGQTYDPSGDYVRKWVPELAALPARFIAQPWKAPAATLSAAGVTLGETYPMPITPHRESRERFLALASQHLQHARAKRRDL